MISLVPGDIWCHHAYYRDAQKNYHKKYLLVLSDVPGSGDGLMAVFTTKPNGLKTDPPCSLGNPREGYYVGVPGGVLTHQSWVAFDSLDFLDELEVNRLVKVNKLVKVSGTISTPLLCSVLRCLLQSSDITYSQAKHIGNTAARLVCS